MGCGWKRWKDEVGIERLKIVQSAWQGKNSVFAKVVRGAVCTGRVVGGVDGSVYTKGWMELLVAGGMKYHRARTLHGVAAATAPTAASAAGAAAATTTAAH
jgi:hypothetical protein